MNTFAWKWWRVAWLVHANWGWSTTVYDDSGRWEKLIGPICILVKRGYNVQEPRHD